MDVKDEWMKHYLEGKWLGPFGINLGDEEDDWQLGIFKLVDKDLVIVLIKMDGADTGIHLRIIDQLMFNVTNADFYYPNKPLPPKKAKILSNIKSAEAEVKANNESEVKPKAEDTAKVEEKGKPK